MCVVNVCRTRGRKGLTGLRGVNGAGKDKESRSDGFGDFDEVEGGEEGRRLSSPDGGSRRHRAGRGQQDAITCDSLPSPVD